MRRPTRDLFEDPYRFDFFQAVRLIEQRTDRELNADGLPNHQRVGHDANPEHELIRFKATPSLGFPPDAINGIKISEDNNLIGIMVTFMGLTGPNGALPQHYTELLLRRLRQKDFSLANFFDVFNHRLISLFYRSWEKYKLPLQFERARRNKQRSIEPFEQSLASLTGATSLEGLDATLIYYSGLFASPVRSALALQGMLADYLRAPVRIDQFQGHWLPLATQDQSRLPAKLQAGQYHQLGRSCVIGSRVWDTQSHFTIRIGPLNQQQFRALQPDTEAFRRLCALAREYAGSTLSFRVEFVLKPGEAPKTLLGKGASASRLGWNGWLIGNRNATTEKQAGFRVSA